ncbi:hypothetical protein FIV42_26365 [Persicimonas caeni]|uniref:DUF3892 domain-containing protein n=1 Tax=Persicimonas caeni TaxID=2292766 RepID=A0A4Y6Q0L7_PERCE|nr:hypothetical protein [Persicimonas caeni]QDG54138.1 hypothetical protein FIV42_26365 [Persicimonas caeni]QED35359.1 hypothetical protein FRD00_26360 [Persicimonas caeni]
MARYVITRQANSDAGEVFFVYEVFKAHDGRFNVGEPSWWNWGKVARTLLDGHWVQTGREEDSAIKFGADVKVVLRTETNETISDNLANLPEG